MKKLIAIITILTLISCGYYDQLEPDRELQKNVETELKENSEVDLQKLTNFEWDYMIVMGPYSNIELVEDSLNLDLKNIRQNGIQLTDFYSLVVFIKDRRSVKIIELSRHYNYSNNELIPAGKSKFEMDQDGILGKVD